MKRLFLAAFLCGLGWLQVSAQEVMPALPPLFFNDSAGVVPASDAATLNERLAQFERDSSNQLLVAVYPKMESDSSIEDYASRIFEAWGVGLKDRGNGAVLLVFVQDRKMRIQTGYGLEGALTDAESFQIIEGMKPFFRAGDYPGGLTYAVNSMIAATEGEFVGTGQTHAESGDGAGLTIAIVIFLIIVFVVMFIQRLQGVRRGYVYDSSGRHVLTGDSGWSSGGWSSGGGSSWSSGGGGGSSFSGGGGSSGGGGASGGW